MAGPPKLPDAPRMAPRASPGEGPPSHISHALVGPPGVTKPPPDATYEAVAPYVSAPSPRSLPPPPSVAASQEEVAAIKQDVAHVQETLLQVHDVMATRSFVGKTEFDALQSTVQGLATQILALTEQHRAVTRATRQLDERRSQTEIYVTAKDKEHDTKLSTLELHLARIRAWREVGKWVAGGVLLAIANHVLTFYQPLAHLR